MAEIKYKQFIVLPKSPKMTTGKLCSQSAHASYLALEKDIDSRIHGITSAWVKNGMCVIVLECKNQQQLLNLDKYLTQWNITHHVYVDEGLYGCEPFTATALATGVLTEDKFWIFENLRLFK
jgi:peptidyl-tRNA hydrolase